MKKTILFLLLTPLVAGAQSLIKLKQIEPITISAGLNDVTVNDSTSNQKLLFKKGFESGKDTGSYNTANLDFIINGAGAFNRTETRRNAARPVQISIVGNAEPTSPVAAFTDFHGVDISGNIGNKSNSFTRIYPFESTARFDATDTTAVLGKMVAGYLQNTVIGKGVVQSSVNLRLRFSNTGGATVDDAAVIDIESPITTGGSITTNFKGIRIAPISGVGSGYGIFSNTYNNYFAGAEIGSTGLAIRGSSTGSSTLLAQVAGTDVTHRLPVNSGTLAIASEVLTKASPVWTSRATGELMTISRTEAAITTPTLAPLNVDITGSPASAPAGSLDLKSCEIIHRLTGANTTANTRSFPLRVISTTNATGIVGRQVAVTGQTNNTGSGTVNQAIVFDAGITHSGSGNVLDWRSYNVSIPTLTAGSIKKATGLYIPILNNVDTVFGLFSDLPSGIYRYNMFAQSTAPSYHNGNFGIGVIPSGVAKLEVTGGIKFNTHAGVGKRAACFDADGTVSTSALLMPYSGSTTFDLPSIAAAGSTTFTVTVTGAAINDVVGLGLPVAAGSSLLIFKPYVSAANTVTVQVQNLSAAAIDLASLTYNVSIIK